MKLANATIDTNKLRTQLILAKSEDKTKEEMELQMDLQMSKLKLGALEREKQMTDTVRAQATRKEELIQMWRQKAESALKTQDELVEKNRTLIRELQQAKSHSKSKDSEISIVQEKLRMTEEVILKSRTKRLEELDARMEAESEQTRARDEALSRLNEQLTSLHEEKQGLMDEVTMRKEMVEAIQRENFGLKGEITSCDAIIGNDGEPSPTESFAAIKQSLEKAVQSDAELERLRNESGQSREMLDEVQGLYDAVKQELEDLRQETGDDATQLDVAQKALEKAQETADAIQSDNENKIEQLNNDIARLNMEVDALKVVEAKLRESEETQNNLQQKQAKKLKEASLKAEQAVTEKNRMELELKPLQQKVAPLEKQKETLTNRVTALSSKIERLESELKSKTQQVEFFSEQVKTAEMKVGMTEEEADALVDKIIELEKKLEGRETIMRAVSDELVNAKQDLAAKRQEVLELEAKMVTMSQMNNQNEEQLYTMNEKVEMAILEVRARDERLSAMTGEVEVLQKSLRDADVQLMTNYQKMKALEDKVKTQMQINSNQVVKLSDSEMEAARLGASLKATTARLDKTREEGKDKSSRLRAAVEKAAQLQELVSTRNQQLSLTKQKMDFARQEARLKDEEAFQATRKLEESKVEMAGHLEMVAPLRARIDELKKVAADAKAQEKHVWLLNEKVSVMQQHIRASEEEAEIAKKRQHLAELQVSTLNDKIDELTRATNKLESESIVMTQSLKRAQAEVNRFRASKELMQAMQMQDFYSAAKDEDVVEEDAKPKRMSKRESRAAAKAAKQAAKEAAAAAVPEPVAEEAEEAEEAVEAAAVDEAAEETAVEEAPAPAEPAPAPEQPAPAPEVGEVADKLTEELEETKEKLAKAEKAIESQAQTNGLLQSELEKAKAQMGKQEDSMQDTVQEYFNSTVLVVKMMLAENQAEPLENVLAADLYEEVNEKKVPVEDWPMYVYMRMSVSQTVAAG